MAANPLQDIGVPLLNGLIPIVTLLCLELLLSGAAMRSSALRALLFGKPSILVENGKVDQSAMHKNRFTLEELTEELRNQSITDISKVKVAILETDGTLNTILYPAEQPVTPAQLGIAVADEGYPVMLINDGKIMEENLALMKKDRTWLRKELKKRGAARPEDVYLLSVNQLDEIYYAPMEGKG